MSFLVAAVVFAQAVAPAAVDTAARTLSVGDRSEIRFRSRLQGGTAVDLETTLGSSLAIQEHHDSLTLSYGPRLSYLDIEGDRSLALIHTGRAEGAWWTRRLRLSLTLDGSIGSQTAIGLASPVLPAADTASVGTAASPLPPPTVPAAPQTLLYFPQVLILQTAAFRGTAGAIYTLSRRWFGGLSSFFSMAGGLNYESQRFLEPYRTEGDDLFATYNADRLDQLTSRVRSTYTWTLISKGDFFTVEAMESIRHAWSARTQGNLGAGMALLSSLPKAGDQRTIALVGTGEASINHTRPLDDGGAISFRAATVLGTSYNAVLAIVQPQLSGTLSSVWTRRPVSLTASADAVTSLPLDSPTVSRVASGSITVGYTPADPVQLQLGVRGFVQVFPPSSQVVYPLQWVTFVAVALRSSLLDF